MTRSQNVIAIVYDYDRTLSPGSMQDDVIFPEIGVEADKFWKDVDKIRQKGAYENELAWIRLLLENPDFRRLSNADLGRFGRNLKFFSGVPEVFGELDQILSDSKYSRHGLTLEHYVVTSSLKTVLMGSSLSSHVEAIFGCELDEDKEGRVFWPKRIVSHTAKTQYLFRITKGPEYVDLSHDVDDHMPEEERRIPFRNMMYIGDGPTDVPCFAVVANRGGSALAVYDPNDKISFKICMGLREAERVHEIAEADYRSGTHLRRIMEYYVERMADRIVAEQEQYRQSRVIEAARPH